MPTIFSSILGPGVVQPQSIRSLAFSLLDSLKGNMPQIVFVFADPQQDVKAVIKGVREIIPTTIVGALSSGTIFSQAGIVRQGVAIGTIYSTDMRFLTVSGRGVERDVESSLEPLFKKILEFKETVLKDGLFHITLLIFVATSHPEIGDEIMDFVRQYELLEGIKIVGGISSDGVIFKSASFNDGIVIVAIASRFPLGIGADSGLIKASDFSFNATKVNANIVDELDEKPAKETLIKKLFNEESELSESELDKIVKEYFLGFESELTDSTVLRSLIRFTENGGIVLGGKVPNSSKLLIYKADKDSLSKAAQRSAVQAKLHVYRNRPSGAIIFEDFARFRFLGEKFSKEIFKIYTEIGAPIIGCDFKGQFVKGPGIPRGFHNASVVILALSAL